METVHPTNYAKAHLAELIREVRSEGAPRVYMGAHRVPQAVLMRPEVDVSSALLEDLLDCAARQIAADAKLSPPDHLDLGPTFTRVVVDLARRPDSMLARFVCALVGAFDEQPGPPIGFDDVLRSLERSGHVPSGTLRELGARLPAEVSSSQATNLFERPWSKLTTSDEYNEEYY